MTNKLLITRGMKQRLHLAFHSLAFFWVLNSFFPFQGFTLGKVLISIVLMFSIAVFGWVLLSRKRCFKDSQISLSLKVLIVLVLLWCLATVARGFQPDVTKIFTLIANPQVGGLIWLLPAAIFLGTRGNFLSAFLPVFRIHAFVGCLLLLLTCVDISVRGVDPLDTPYQVGGLLCYGAFISLLTGVEKTRDGLLFLSTITIFVVASYLLNNRYDAVVGVLVFVLASFIGTSRSAKYLKIRFLGFVIASVFFLVYGIGEVLSRLDEVWFVDTRTFLVAELIDDFSLNDLIVGRGALGTYYSPYFDYNSRMNIPGDAMDRQVSEIGYLHLVLKAGIVGAMLFVIPIIVASWKSLSFWNRRLGVGISIYLMIHVLGLLISARPIFSMEFIMIWMLVGFVISQKKPDIDQHPTFKAPQVAVLPENEISMVRNT